MEPAGLVKDDSVIPNVCSALAGILCGEHETKSVNTTSRSSNDNTEESSRNAQSYTTYDLFRKIKIWNDQC